MIKIIEESNENDWPSILARPELNTQVLSSTVSKILQEVKQYGDKAVVKFTTQFDEVLLQNNKVTQAEIDDAVNAVSIDLKNAINIAIENITSFHLVQQVQEPMVTTMPGVQCWRKSIAIESVGLYIPGGTASLFSTLLMLAIPATIAACKNIIVCTPPDKKGNIHPAILYIAKVLALKNVYKIGGVQAIAAMAYGTDTIKKVNKIFGPGNQYVTCAKQLVNQQGIAIDMPAGPSELAIYADDTCVPAYVAADILSQAEHGIDSQIFLVVTNNAIATAVNNEVSKQLQNMVRKQIATKALENSKCIIITNTQHAFSIINEYAPEHLIIASSNASLLQQLVINAGSVFLGNNTPESAGDYASGTNHTLPTNGNAKAYSGVSLDSFYKKITFQQITKAGISLLANTIITMANAEGLAAHAHAVKIRIDN